MALDIITIDTPHTPVRVLRGGQGKALLYIHGAGGAAPNDPLLEALTEHFDVYAPLMPGYGDSEECHELRDMLDITLHYWDVVAALGLKKPIIVGHSMGGMIAAEMAAIAPNDVARLGLIASAGLWDDDHPVADLFSLLPYELPKVLFHNAEAGAAMLTAGRKVDDPNFLQNFLVQNARQLGMAGRLLFPIPDRGLAQRLYRIKAKTQIVWGDSDRMTPPIYARKFKDAIKGAKLTSIPEAGHMVTWEKPAHVVEALKKLG